MYPSYIANAIAERIKSDARKAAHIADGIADLLKNEARENDVMSMLCTDADIVRRELGGLASQLERVATVAAEAAAGIRARHPLPTSEW